MPPATLHAALSTAQVTVSLTSALCPGYSLTPALYCVEVTSYSAPVLCVADGSQHDQQTRSPHAECGNHGGHKEDTHREQLWVQGGYIHGAAEL